MEAKISTLITTFVPRMPLILGLWILNKLGLSPACDKQDAIVEVIVYIGRSLTGLRRPIGLLQSRSIKDPGIRGNIWVSKVGYESDACVRDAVVRGTRSFGSGDFTVPDITDVEAEWVGHRAEATKRSPRLPGSEAQQYDYLMGEAGDVTILYFHGGGYFLLDPATYRATTGRLAKRTKGRCLAVRYRLAPQNAFPAALVDALTSYLYLLAAPSGSYHEAVPAGKIVFAGDSAGGNLACALVLLLLTLKRDGVKSIVFHGKEVPLELPAGVALLSPWVDLTRTMPSIWDNAKYDFLQTPEMYGRTVVADDVWPVSPPREDKFCQASMLAHPLVSPVIATSDMWRGCPPVFVAGGNETLEDEFTVLARNMYLSGTPVEFRGYEGMPHCFAMGTKAVPMADHCFNLWADFCTNAVKGTIQRKDEATWWKAKTSPSQFYEVKLADMGVPDDVVRDKMHSFTATAMSKEQEELREWEKSSHR